MKPPKRQQAFDAHRRGDLAGAERLYRELLQAAPGDAELQHYLGVLCFQAGRGAEALAWLRRAQGRAPGSRPTLQLLLQLCEEAGDAAGALAALEPYLRLHPDDADMLNAKGQQLVRLGRPLEAEPAFRQAAEGSGRAALFHDLGVCRQMLGDLPGAASAYGEALRRGHEHPRTRLWLAQCLRALGRTADYYRVAADSLALSADDDLALQIEAQSARRHVCDWDGFEQHQPALLAGLQRALADNRAHDIPPGVLNYLEVGEDRIAAVARQYARQLAAAGAALRGKRPGPAAREKGTKLRLGYLSTDFYSHAVGSLVCDLFARHDRDRFEVYGYSLRHRADAVQARIQQGLDHYRNLAGRSADDMVRAIRADRIDILVDLAGYTSAAQPAVLAARPAPLQLSWLGYLGTSGGDHIDYLIADDIALPESLARHYRERILRLPCFLVASPLPLAAVKPGRREAGLTPTGPVFCSFNQPYKLDRATFRAWMEILRQVPDSQLWLFSPDSEICSANLRREAGRLGVEGERLVFAPRLPMGEHVARLALADLALDPFHISGGATSVTCLAAGVPVLTLRGDSFLSRMGSSLNHHLGLQELDCSGPGEYIAHAVELAHTPARLARLRDRLGVALANKGFFDPSRFVQTLEAGLEQAWQRHRAGEPTADLRVGASAPRPAQP